MFQTYVTFHPFIFKFKNENDEVLLRGATEDLENDKMLVFMMASESIQIDLQMGRNFTIRNSWNICGNYWGVPSIDFRLSPDARIAQSPYFENAILLFQCAQEMKLLVMQRNFIKRFFIPNLLPKEWLSEPALLNERVVNVVSTSKPPIFQ